MGRLRAPWRSIGRRRRRSPIAEVYVSCSTHPRAAGRRRSDSARRARLRNEAWTPALAGGTLAAGSGAGLGGSGSSPCSEIMLVRAGAGVERRSGDRQEHAVGSWASRPLLQWSAGLVGFAQRRRGTAVLRGADRPLRRRRRCCSGGITGPTTLRPGRSAVTARTGGRAPETQAYGPGVLDGLRALLLGRLCWWPSMTWSGSILPLDDDLVRGARLAPSLSGSSSLGGPSAVDARAGARTPCPGAPRDGPAEHRRDSTPARRATQTQPAGGCWTGSSNTPGNCCRAGLGRTVVEQGCRRSVRTSKCRT